MIHAPTALVPPTCSTIMVISMLICTHTRPRTRQVQSLFSSVKICGCVLRTCCADSDSTIPVTICSCVLRLYCAGSDATTPTRFQLTPQSISHHIDSGMCVVRYWSARCTDLLTCANNALVFILTCWIVQRQRTVACTTTAAICTEPADAKTAALIRNCTKQIVKENITHDTEQEYCW